MSRIVDDIIIFFIKKRRFLYILESIDILFSLFKFLLKNNGYLKSINDRLRTFNVFFYFNYNNILIIIIIMLF